jgi:hypothetical protein
MSGAVPLEVARRLAKALDADDFDAARLLLHSDVTYRIGADESDSDPAEWMPPRKKFHCDYAKQYTAVKWRWRLKVNESERTKLRRVIQSCGDKRILKPHRADIKTGSSGGGGSGDRCDPNYAGACIPIVNYDLDCSDIPDRNFRVVGRDIHGFDGDGDGIACES